MDIVYKAKRNSVCKAPLSTAGTHLTMSIIVIPQGIHTVAHYTDFPHTTII